MRANSKVTWTDHTFNPWWGCTKVSPGCDNCYAETFAKRCGFSVWGKDSGRRSFGAKHWDEPFDWDAAAQGYGRKRVFCGSMCDILEDLPELLAARNQVWRMVEDTQWLDWLILSKRPQNFRKMIPAEWLEKPPANFWAMTTVENWDYLWRASYIRETPAAVRGLSCEPLLGPLPLLFDNLHAIDWVIVGAESGPHARPMDEDWVRDIRDQCIAAGVKFFYKQRIENGRKVELPELDGRVWAQIPEVEA